jgi:hypothetical protein
MTKELTNIKDRTSDIVIDATSMKISNRESFEYAVTYLKIIKELEKEVKATFDPIVKETHKAWRTATEQRKKYLNPINDAEGTIKRKIANYHMEQEKIRREEEEKKRRELEEKERELQLQKAIELEEQGKNEKAVETLEKEIEIPIINVESKTKAEGISYRSIWKFEITDFEAVPNEFKMIDLKKIGAIVRAMKDQTNIPGVKAYEEKTVAAKC